MALSQVTAEIITKVISPADSVDEIVAGANC